MKHILNTLLIMIATMCIATSCHSKNSDKTAESQQNPTAQTVSESSKTLIVYFSKRGVNYKQGSLDKGNTEVVAEYIQEFTGADVFRIVPVKSYEDEQDYDKLVEQTRVEHDKDVRPALVGKVENIDQYDTVIIGSPIWWYTYPQVVYTFLDAYDLNGKTIIPFTTHEGSGLADVMDVLQKYYPQATVAEGLAIKGRDARDSKAKVAEWLKGNGFGQ